MKFENWQYLFKLKLVQWFSLEHRLCSLSKICFVPLSIKWFFDITSALGAKTAANKPQLRKHYSSVDLFNCLYSYQLLVLNYLTFCSQTQSKQIWFSTLFCPAYLELYETADCLLLYSFLHNMVLYQQVNLQSIRITEFLIQAKPREAEQQLPDMMKAALPVELKGEGIWDKSTPVPALMSRDQFLGATCPVGDVC